MQEMKELKWMNQQLTQEEIDALLAGGSEAEPDLNDYLTAMEQDAVGEIGNIAMSAAATNLSLLISKKVRITTPSVSMVTLSRQKEEYERPFVSVQVTFREGVEGANVLIIQDRDAVVIAQLMMGFDGEVEEHPHLGELELSALSEAMNQMMGAAATAMSSMLERRILISSPQTTLVDKADDTLTIIPVGEEELLVKVAFRIAINDNLDSTVMQLIPFPLAKQMVALLMGEQQPLEVEKTMPQEPKQRPKAQPEAPAPTEVAKEPVVQPAEFMPLRELHEGDTQKMDLLMDVPLQVTVELGRAQMTIKDILNLGEGSVVELDKLAGEPVDVLVNGQLVAKGEVVVIDENFGIKIADLVREKTTAI
jgi:flagellar motor switch protein FliN/FliY